MWSKKTPHWLADAMHHFQLFFPSAFCELLPLTYSSSRGTVTGRRAAGGTAGSGADVVALLTTDREDGAGERRGQLDRLLLGGQAQIDRLGRARQRLRVAGRVVGAAGGLRDRGQQRLVQRGSLGGQGATFGGTCSCTVRLMTPSSRVDARRRA